MRRFFLLFLLFCMGLTSCRAPSQKTGDIKKSESEENIYIKYQYSSEIKNDRIEVNNEKLTYSYVDENRLDDLPEILEQRPYWTSDDMITIEKDLSDSQIKELKEIINSGFFNLNDIEGMKEEGERYYPYTISVNVGERSKTVEYRSNPQADKMPDVFEKLLNKLYSLTGVGQ
ncbi:MAG: hypothetical protein PHV06_03710 [bacterium]|nr:hypothetical protein [bacterium]